MTNPANDLKDFMWQFLMDKGQKKGINWSELDMVLMSIVIEATALVQSGVLDKIEEDT